MLARVIETLSSPITLHPGCGLMHCSSGKLFAFCGVFTDANEMAPFILVADIQKGDTMAFAD